MLGGDRWTTLPLRLTEMLIKIDFIDDLILCNVAHLPINIHICYIAHGLQMQMLAFMIFELQIHQPLKILMMMMMFLHCNQRLFLLLNYIYI